MVDLLIVTKVKFSEEKYICRSYTAKIGTRVDLKRYTNNTKGQTGLHCRPTYVIIRKGCKKDAIDISKHHLVLIP